MNQENELTSEAHWDSNWKDFEPTIIKENDKILGQNGAFIKTLDKRWTIPPFSSVLELGGACSAYLCSLTKFRQVRASVIDYSKVGLSNTTKLFQLNGCNVDLHYGDLFSYEFPHSEFDCVVHWGLIEHFKDPIEVFSLSAKLLKPSGAAIFTMPNMEAYGVGLWKKYDTSDYNTHIYHSDEFISQLAEASGFSVHSIYYWGPPLYFNAGYWFKDQSFLKFVINFFVRCCSLISKIVPIFNIGHRKISAHRAFILIKD